jgi:ADP-ribosylglycohydrolase
MCAFVADDALHIIAVQEANLTHEHELAGDVSAAVVVLCRLLVRGVAWDQALEMAEQGRERATQAALSLTRKSRLDSGGFAPDALQAAVFFVGNNSTFDTALSEAFRFAGPANYCPVLVGSIAGARWGAAQIVIDCHQPNEILSRALEVSDGLGSQWLGRRPGEAPR